MKKAAAYCRVSTDRQKDEKTIESQKMELQDWAEKNDTVIVDWFVDDGWSGDMLARPELDRLRDDLDRGFWDAVVFTDRDRLARKYAYQELVIEEIQEKRKELIFIHSANAKTAEDKILQGFQGLFAEYERVKITERMRRGKMHKAKVRKIIVGHQAPFGYVYVAKTKEKEGYYKIKKADAEIVKKIFHWVGDDGYTIYQVIRELYAKGIIPPKAKRNVWVKSTIRRMLHNETYIGTAYYNKTKSVVPKNPIKNGKYKKIKKSSRTLKPRDEWVAIPVPAFIDKKLFDRVQIRLKENERFKKGFRKHNYLLTGLVKCKCGFNRVGDAVHKHHYYRCASRIYKFPVPTKCEYEGINSDVLDKLVWDRLMSFLKDSDAVRSNAEDWLNSQETVESKNETRVGELEKAISELDEEEKRYLKVYAQKLMPFDKLRDLLKGVKAKRKSLEDEVEKTNNTVVEEDIPLGDLDDVCLTILQTIKYASDKERKKYAQRMLYEVLVGERREALVKGAIPLPQKSLNIPYGSISRYCRLGKRWHQNQ